MATTAPEGVEDAALDALDERSQRPTVGLPCLTPAGLRLRYTPFPPSPKQAAFLALTNREALFGGAGGGGKSIALLMAALQFADVPGYNALILRRKLTDLKLPDGIIDVSRDWLEGNGPSYNANDFCWTFPSGAKLQFGYMAQLGSEQRYKSSQFQFIGFDELTEFPWEEQYTYLFSRLRRAIGPGAAVHGPAPDGLTLADVPLRIRGATNPGGPGMTWVKARFVDPDSARRPFLPSRLEDNPGIDAAEYRESLAELSEVERKRLEEGDWDVYEIPGALWGFADLSWNDRIEPLPAELVDVRALAIDPSVSEETGKGDEVGIVMGSTVDGVLVVELDVSGRMHPDDWAKLAVNTYHAYGCTRVVVEDNQGKALVTSALGNAADVLGVQRPRVVQCTATESKEARAIPVAQAYRATPTRVVHNLNLRSGKLEAQLTSWVPQRGSSPDRLDALVWLARHLLFGEGRPVEFHSPPPSTRSRLSGRMPGT